MLHISLTYPAGRMVELDTYVYKNAETEGLKQFWPPSLKMLLWSYSVSERGKCFCNIIMWVLFSGILIKNGVWQPD